MKNLLKNYIIHTVTHAKQVFITCVVLFVLLEIGAIIWPHSILYIVAPIVASIGAGLYMYHIAYPNAFIDEEDDAVTSSVKDNNDVVNDDQNTAQEVSGDMVVDYVTGKPRPKDAVDDLMDALANGDTESAIKYANDAGFGVISENSNGTFAFTPNDDVKATDLIKSISVETDDSNKV